MIKLGLQLLPFRTLRRWLGARAQAPGVRREVRSPSHVGWAVAAVGRPFPTLSHCLTQALATQLLLGQAGHAAALRIGVAKGEGGKLEAHAWVESAGKIVIGGLDDLARFTPLPSLEGWGK